MPYAPLFGCRNGLAEDINIPSECLELNNNGCVLLKDAVSNLKAILRFILTRCEFCESVKIVTSAGNVDIAAGNIKSKRQRSDHYWVE